MSALILFKYEFRMGHLFVNNKCCLYTMYDIHVHLILNQEQKYNNNENIHIDNNNLENGITISNE